ncbi:adenosylcobinamide amidohydrolase [Streptomyces sp. NPDC006553]|uniref:adenosylcobinamide amidohydrolase n=1 Tax=unclassified Streptomyces TaxID=2593676 RepID=UPI00225806B0|nr:adenosylcobinamide amidohydrolase [Streptomyces sp. NBC_00233]MCX5232305.1 adenosylcobinamide amidohydrolase [Streptomyces sp. NBC_00233]
MPTRTLLTSTSLADAALLAHTEQGRDLPLLVWTPGPGIRMVSSAVLGGGIGEREWVINAQVPPGYDRLDPVAHLRDLAAGAGLTGAGVGLMTAASVADRCHAEDGGVRAVVTAGIGVRGWAAAPGVGGVTIPRPGTINIIVSLPVPLTDAALVNAVATATEAKVQALVELGADASGTPTDAVCVAAPTPTGSHTAPGTRASTGTRTGTGTGTGTEAQPFAGPRSLWGARLARAVHAATRAACTGLITS